ncbi:hypothetical protein MHL31_03380 [Lutibacter sp. A80]|uniref:hypothetical protein n=1 Tax=Lutibacter sp. A80 TaxID=2918453 RepID=UPI001F05D40C|nr:hypothetical protein [Lutibacter sp. A80]UMB61251.1 hypothetical protein MHL31_03380 [Lutibacter sp. A80]
MKNSLFILISLIVFSCNSNDEISNNSEYSEFINGNSIESDITFMPEEIYLTNEAQEPQLKLRLITEEIYPCINYGIATTAFINTNELIIRFDGLIIPELCLTAIGPATSYIDLTENITKITFINGDIIDSYSIVINEEKVIIEPFDINFTNSLYNKTFRIPENSFAYVCGTNTNNTEIYTDFLTILEQNPNFTTFEFDGEGRVPYQESSDGHWVNHPSKFFTYTNIDEFNNLETILNNFSKDVIEENSGVTIVIYGWNNINFN